MRNIHKINQRIYITSDEEIKEGDYYLYGAEIIQANGLVGFHISLINDCKKIIITNDPELKIQLIRDEFLQWFAKNPSCEEVEVVSKDLYYDKEYWYTHYKTIIPKQETLEEVELAVLFHNTYERLAPSFGYETREDTKSFDITTPNVKLMIAVCKEIIKWQQERSYSDMQEYAIFCIECDRKEMPLLLVEDWYKHYKKK